MRPSRSGIALLLVVLATGAAAQTADVPIDRYRHAAGLGETGTIRGRAFEERRRPGAPDLPLSDTVVMVVPRSEAWLTRLQGIKRGSRDSVDAYRMTAGAVRRAWETYEKSLLEAGAGDLPQTVKVDSEGVFVLDVPAGAWILLASRSSYVDKTPAGGAQRTVPGPFMPQDRLSGYHIVTYWMREIALAAGATEAVELTDRNVWLTGVIESRVAPPPPDAPHTNRRPH